MSSASRSRSSASRSGTSASRSRAIVRYDSDSEDSTDSDDQNTGQSSKRRKQTDHQLDEESFNRIVSDCVKYMLIFDQKKIPLKRVDMFKAVMKRSPGRKTAEEIIERVSSQLAKAFGIELVECPEVANTFILVNQLPTEGLAETIDNDSISESQHFRSGLLSVVLALIFMSGESIPEDNVWKFLTKLGFNVKSKTPIPLINDDSNGITIKKLMTELWVRQLYLKYQKIPRSDPLTHEFRWGLRAEKEFNKLDVINFVCKLFADDSKPEYWRTQYAAAIKQSAATNAAEEEDDDDDVEVLSV